MASFDSQLRSRGPQAVRPNVDVRETLLDFEADWRDRSHFLEAHGYRLRPRLRPGWKPSWHTSGKSAWRAEDAVWSHMRPSLMDATRISDGRAVYIKKIRTGDLESTIASYLDSTSLRARPDNHSAPVLEVFPDPSDPSVSYMVMPFLRPMTRPPFEYVGEILDFGEQILEGLVFMHEQGVAHRDCSEKNIMMDGDSVYPMGNHPVSESFLPDFSGRAPVVSRLVAGPRYYFVDYGISTQVAPGTTSVMVLGTLGREQDVPELSEEVPYDPFKVDIFTIGCVLRRVFYKPYSNAEFIAPFIELMTRTDPSARPSAAECLARWRGMRRTFSALHRHWRLKERTESMVHRAVFDLVHTTRVASHLAQWLKGQRFRGS
ncbi:kinase-like domain-containing protein [Amylostereum chailletii]|nr:kinase-like domain-containing protein [Amylostereum chailletii]